MLTTRNLKWMNGGFKYFFGFLYRIFATYFARYFINCDTRYTHPIPACDFLRTLRSFSISVRLNLYGMFTLIFDPIITHHRSDLFAQARGVCERLDKVKYK